MNDHPAPSEAVTGVHDRLDDPSGRVPRRRWRRRLAATLLVLVSLVLLLSIVVVTGLHVGPIDRPSYTELEAIGAKLDATCPSTRIWGGSRVDVLRARVHGPLLSGHGLTDREIGVVVDDRRGCNISTAID